MFSLLIIIFFKLVYLYNNLNFINKFFNDNNLQFLTLTPKFFFYYSFITFLK